MILRRNSFRNFQHRLGSFRIRWQNRDCALEILEDRRLLAASTSAPLIEGVAFLDADGNGTFTAGEELEGVSIRLFLDADDDGAFEPGTDDTQQGITITTDQNGEYCFDNLDGNSQFFVFQPAQTVDGNVLMDMVSDPISPGSADLLIDDAFNPVGDPAGDERGVIADSINTIATRTFTQADDSHIIGTERDFFAELTSGVGEVELRADKFDSGLLQFATTAGVQGTISATWDGADMDASTISMGLNGVDLTDGGNNLGLGMPIGADLASNASVVIRIYQGSDTNFTEVTELIPITTNGTATDYLFIPFSSFSSGPVSPSNVDAIVMEIDGTTGPSFDGEIEFIGAIAPKTANFANAAGMDLQITKANVNNSVTPGNAITYSILVENLGPNDVTGASVTDTFDTSRLTNISYTSVATGSASGNTASGSGDISDTVNLPVGDTITYTVAATITADATGNLINTANVNPPSGVTDSDLTNNDSTVTDTLIPNADLSVTKDDGLDSVSDGDTISYTVTVSNNGPSDAVGATVTDSFPGPFTNSSVTTTLNGNAAVTSSGTNSLGISDVVDIPVGDSIVYTVTTTIDGTGVTDVMNTATVTEPSGTIDPDPTNNSATDTNAINETDLMITKTNSTTDVTPGGTVSYTIVVTNDSDITVTDARVVDNFPTELSNISYTSSITGSVSGHTAVGTGNIDELLTMAPGSSIQYDVTADISSSATGVLTNDTTVAPPVGITDMDTSNNSDSESDNLVPQFDLAVVKSVDQTTVEQGQSVTYTITVTNTGPSDATNALVSDFFPSEFSSVSYSSSASGGATGNTTSGTTDISDTVDIPAGGQIVYTVQATASATANTGVVTNTADVNASGDTVSSNNSNAVDVTITSTSTSTDLEITKTDNVTNVTSGGSLTYIITATNNGPNNVVGATITDTFSIDLENISFTSVATGGATGNTTAGTDDINDTVDLPVGATITYTVDADVVGFTDDDVIRNTATITAPGGISDTDLANNQALDINTVDAVEVDLSITKTDGLSSVRAGDSLNYTITVSNVGSQDVTGASVTDILPTTLTNVTFTSQANGGATGNTANGTGDLNETLDLPVGSSVVYTVSGQVVDPTSETSIANTAEVDVPAGFSDTDPSNNTATDLDTILAIDAVLAQLQGFVYLDQDGDGNFDDDEAPISGVEIILEQNGVEIATSTTGADGSYIFQDLNPGNYIVRESQPDGFSDGQESVVGGIGTVDANDTFSVPLAAGDNATGLNFGESIRRPSKRDLLASNFSS